MIGRRLAYAWTFVYACTHVTPAMAAAQDQPIILRVGTALDGRGGVMENVHIVIQGPDIVRVDGQPAVATYDLSRLTVMPGGVDTHTHLDWHFDGDGRLHDDPDETPQQAMLYAVENAYQTLMGGITTVQNLGSRRDADLRDAIARGSIPGPRILTSLQSLSVRSGTPDEIRERIRALAADGVDVIKIFASASIRVGGTPTMSQDQLRAACDEASGHGLRTAVHAHGPESARRAVIAGCTVIEHGALLDDETLELMALRGTYYDPNIHLIFRNYFENRDRYIGIGSYTDEGFAQMEAAVPTALDVFKRALTKPGLRIVFGTDAVAGAAGRNFEELIYRVEVGGQSPMDAIVSATSLAAESLDLGRDIGAIAEGMAADIIGLDGNPLEDITALRRVLFVMKGGIVYKHTAPSGAR